MIAECKDTLRRKGFAVVLIILTLPLPAIATSQGDENTYKTEIDAQVFTLTTPIQPIDAFSRHKPKISLNDPSIFNNTGGLELAKFSWIFSKGLLLRRDEGGFELNVFIRPSTEIDVSTIGGLKQHLMANYNRRFSAQGIVVKEDFFDEVPIRNRTWLKYRIPVSGTNAYATSISNNRFLVVQFFFVDNTGNPSAPWLDQARELAHNIISSLQIE